MKKIALVLIVILSMIHINIISYADVSVNQYAYAWDSDEAVIPLDEIAANCYIFNCNGEDFIYSELTATNPVKYNKQEADFFIKQFSGPYYCHDYLWTGEYYMVRLHGVDNIPQSHSGYDKFPIRLYDKNYNLVKEYVFDKYVYKIDYFNNIYYCYVEDEGWLSSEDFQNWNKSENISTLTTSNIRYINNQVSINNSDFYSISYECDEQHNIYRTIGDYIFGSRQNKILVSLDNIYFVNIGIPIECSGFSGVYCKDDNIVYEGKSRYFGARKKERMYISKDGIDEELEQLKQSPYIKYNDTILAFEQPPVIENDRTLIPIRFLFEQMGATVDWNGDTQTATISQDNTAVAFSIDDTDADVNGQTVSMDVPARLINGKTMVPVRFLSEELGYDVDWDGENRIITIK